MDLFAPGDTNADGRIDLGARNRGTGDDGDGLADQSTKLRTGTNFTVTGVPMPTSPR